MTEAKQAFAKIVIALCLVIAKMKNKETINIVWLKRDIRSQDHLPLKQAEESALPYLIIFLFEPSIISHPDTSTRHLQFQYQALCQLNKKLQNYQQIVQVFYAEALAVCYFLQEKYTIKNIFSYQESGIQLTYDRDKAVAKFCTQHQIHWQQSQRDGILRGIKNRSGWDKQWFAVMHSPIIHNTFSKRTKISNVSCVV
jgi:deoxyribodipyrimidine photo-lyase